MQPLRSIGRLSRIAGIIGVACALAGCGGVPWDKTPLPNLEAFPSQPFDIYQEYRQVRRVVAPGISLGVVPEGGFLRLGVLHEGAVSKRLHVYAGNTRVQTLEVTGDTAAWFDFRVDLGAHTGETARLWFGEHAPVNLGPLAMESPVNDGSPKVLIFLIDTLRQDHLGCYGYERDTSPNIDAFARDSVRFTHLTPPSSWTRPAVATLLHGVQPNRHGAHDRVDLVRGGLPSLAEHLRRAGCVTEAFLTNPNVLPAWNLFTDFERVHDAYSTRWERSEDDALAVEAAMASIDRLEGLPWFLYVHTMAPHGPYHPPAPYDTRFRTPGAAPPEPVEILGFTYAGRRGAVDLYDGEIAYADAIFGELMDHLKARGEYDESLIMLLSDHGEEFADHGGWDHGKTLYEEQLRVPLLIKLPGNTHAGRVCEDLIEMADLAPTLLDVLGLVPEPRFDGRSVRALLEGGVADSRMAYASLFLDEASMQAAKSRRHKIIENEREESRVWFDLNADPEEKTPLSAMPDKGDALFSFLRERNIAAAAGLQMLITDAPSTARDIEIEIRGAAPRRVDAFYPEPLVTLESDGPEVYARFRMHEKRHLYPDAERYHNTYQQDGARLRVLLPPEAKPAITVRANGQPVPAEAVYLGSEGRHAALDDTPLDLPGLAADPSDFDLALLPRRFAVYLWYVAPPQTRRDETLEPAMREALDALGYIE